MKNKKAEKVIKRIQEENEVYSIKILGDRENKVNAFGILMSTQQFISDKQNIYHGIKKNSIDLLKEANIKFEIIK